MPDVANDLYGSWDDECSDVGDLLEILDASRPAWHADAACKEHPELSWFPERGITGPEMRALREVCAGCLVVGECRAWALGQGAELDGMWAGMTGHERQRMRAGRAA